MAAGFAVLFHFVWKTLVAVSKGMRAVKLCTNRILQFLTGGAS